jgi:hypothetical protein
MDRRHRARPPWRFPAGRPRNDVKSASEADPCQVSFFGESRSPPCRRPVAEERNGPRPGAAGMSRRRNVVDERDLGRNGEFQLCPPSSMRIASHLSSSAISRGAPDCDRTCCPSGIGSIRADAVGSMCAPAGAEACAAVRGGHANPPPSIGFGGTSLRRAPRIDALAPLSADRTGVTSARRQALGELERFRGQASPIVDRVHQRFGDANRPAAAVGTSSP